MRIAPIVVVGLAVVLAGCAHRDRGYRSKTVVIEQSGPRHDARDRDYRDRRDWKLDDRRRYDDDRRYRY